MNQVSNQVILPFKQSKLQFQKLVQVKSEFGSCNICLVKFNTLDEVFQHIQYHQFVYKKWLTIENTIFKLNLDYIKNGMMSNMTDDYPKFETTQLQRRKNQKSNFEPKTAILDLKKSKKIQINEMFSNILKCVQFPLDMKHKKSLDPINIENTVLSKSLDLEQDFCQNFDASTLEPMNNQKNDISSKTLNLETFDETSLEPITYQIDEVVSISSIISDLESKYCSSRRMNLSSQENTKSQINDFKDNYLGFGPADKNLIKGKTLLLLCEISSQTFVLVVLMQTAISIHTYVVIILAFLFLLPIYIIIF